MIQDLKADSARWEQERRAASRTGGGTTHSSQTNGIVRNSNSPTGSREQARGQDYNTWKNRQERGVQDYETTYPASGGMAMDIDYPPKPVNSPSAYAAAPQYQVPASGYPAGAYPPQPPLGGAPGQYGGQGYAYPPQPPAQYPPGPQAGSGGYPGMPGPQAIPAGFGQDPYTHGSNYQTSPGYVTAGGAARPLVSSAAASRSLYAPTVAAPVYSDPNDPYAYAGAATSANDPFLGRGAYNVATNPAPAPSDDLGSPAGAQQPRTGYGGVPESQYDEVSALPPSSSTSTTPAQLVTSGGPPNPRHNRESEPRDARGDHRDHRARRSEADRDDRHASARHRHR